MGFGTAAPGTINMNYGKHRSERDDPWDSRIRRQPGIGEFARGIANIFDVCFFIYIFIFLCRIANDSWRELGKNFEGKGRRLKISR